jgi:hypothetical protein
MERTALINALLARRFAKGGRQIGNELFCARTP